MGKGNRDIMRLGYLDRIKANTFNNMSQWSMHYENILRDYCTSEFSYTGLEEFNLSGLNSRVIEKQLYTHGTVAIFRDNDFPGNPLMVLPYNRKAYRGIYGEPVDITVRITIRGRTYQRDLKKGEYVILNNNGFVGNQPPQVMVSLYADELAKIRDDIRINRNAVRTPLIMLANGEKMLQAANLLKDIMGPNAAILADEDIASIKEGLTAINTGAPYVVDKLTEHLHDVFNEVCTFIGMENSNTDKKERMVADEANATQQQVNRSRDSRYKERVQAFNEVNKMFGTNIEVVKNQDVIDFEEIKKEIIQTRLEDKEYDNNEIQRHDDRLSGDEQSNNNE